MEWRPFDTAPADGSCFLAYYPQLHWNKIRLCSRDQRSPKYGFWALWGGGVQFSKRNLPTHWMPLPEPPKPIESTIDESTGNV